MASAWIIGLRARLGRRNGSRSSHALDLLGKYLDGDANLAGTPVGVPLLTRVLLGQRVDMVVGALLGHLDDSPADLQVSIGVVGILDRERDLRIGFYILVLDPASRGVEPDVRAVVVDPDGSHLRRAVAPDGRDMGERLFRQQITIALGNRRHGHLSWSRMSRQPIVVVSSPARASAMVRRASSMRTTHCWTSSASCVNGSASHSRADSGFSAAKPSVGDNAPSFSNRSSAGRPDAPSRATTAPRTAPFQIPVSPSITAA